MGSTLVIFHPSEIGAAMCNEAYGQFQLDLLQSWRLRRNGGILHVAPRQQRLIAALALRGPHLRSYLIGLLWPELTDSRALENLRVSLHMVCRELPGLLVNDGPMLSLSDQVDVDLYRISTEIRQLDMAAIKESGSVVLHSLRNAELLPGWYEDWVLFEQSRLQQDRLRAFTKIARESFSQRHYDVAAEAAEAALELEPLYESAVRLLIQAEALQGNTASAVRAFDKFQRKLLVDMGLRPSDDALKLIASIRDGHACAGDEGLVAAGSA